MNELCKYLKILNEVAKKKLQEYFNTENLPFSDFDFVNSYLIYQTIRDTQRKPNTLIHIPHKGSKHQFYIPTIILLSLYNFVDNYLDNITEFNEGDTLQKGRDRYVIGRIYGDKAVLAKKDTANSKYPNVPLENLKSYIKTYANANSARVHNTFSSYRSFFKETVSGITKDVPSQFKYKSVIITDKKIVDELKKFEIQGQKIHKAIPFQYVTRSGKISDNIPIDPMIYIVNDYQTARNQILNKGIKIRNVSVIGSSKYRESYRELSEDLNNKRYENCLLIGSADIPDNTISNLFKWNWTLPELEHFSFIESNNPEIAKIEDLDFQNKIDDFFVAIKHIEQSFGVNLKGLLRYARNILPLTIPKENSRLANQLDQHLAHFNKDGFDSFESEFCDKDLWEEIDDQWFQLAEKYNSLIKHKRRKCSKYSELDLFDRIDYLVVPKDNIPQWEDESDSRRIRNIISYKEFKSLDNKNKTIVFLGFYGMDHLRITMYNTNNIYFLLYPQEEAYFHICQSRFQNDIYKHIKNKDRQRLCEISFQETKQIENVSGLIKRLFEKDGIQNSNPDNTTEYDTNLEYILTFDNGTDTKVLDENKTVIVQVHNAKRDEKVKNLKSGDRVRIYDNVSKDTLYEIALEADEDGHFQQIEQYSNFWKNRLSNYGDKFSSLDTFLIHLQEKGISILSEATLRSWTNPESRVRFPQSRKDLVLIKKLTEIEDKDFRNIMISRSAYNSIMIALGRDLSDEITDYIKDGSKGRILQKFTKPQIEKFAELNAPLITIQSILIFSNDE